MFPTLLARMHGRDSRALFFLLQATVAFVLLIACANIANLLLARSSRRAHEMAVRLALGASRGRLLRQLLTESVLLAACGGALGVMLTLWGIRLARALGGFPDVIDPTLNTTVLGFTVLVSMTTGVLCGIVPAVRASNVTPGSTLRADGGRGGSERPAQGRLRAGLVAIQIASATVLATGAGLMVQTLTNRQHVDLGFDPRGAARADLVVTGRRYTDEDSVRRAVETILERIGHHPDVATAGMSGWALSSRVGAELHVTLSERGNVFLDAASTPRAVEAVTGGYFDAMGIPLTRGRAFADRDRGGAPGVAIVNEAFARLAWPGDPLGAVVRLDAGSESAVVTIVGVAGSIRRSAMHDALVPRIYVPYAQFPSASVTFVARTRGDVARAVRAMFSTVREADPALVLDAVRTAEADAAQFLAPVRFLTILYAAFGLTALLLAALGVFGTMSYTVSQRQREMAVRTALGAGRGDLIRLVLKSGLLITALGLAPGLLAAIATGRALGSHLYGVAPTDPVTLGVVCAVLTVVSLAACYRPARAAATVDPMTILGRE